MDRSLDEIVAEAKMLTATTTTHRTRGPRRGRVLNSGGDMGGRRPGRGRDRDSYPGDGVRKHVKEDLRNLDSEWVHDRFENNGFSYDRPYESTYRGAAGQPSSHSSRGTLVKVDNLHYELERVDLEGLFSKIGPVESVELVYDRAGRSEGIAYVTYERYQDAKNAIAEFDGANAKGQPIHLSIIHSSSRRGGFHTARSSGRSLAERITYPSRRARSLSPAAEYGDRQNNRGVDRYVPDKRGRSRSPLPRRRGGRRPGERREGGEGGVGAGHRGGRGERDEPRRGRDGRPRKTQEELDAEMADYFGPSDGNDAASALESVEADGDTVMEDVDMVL